MGGTPRGGTREITCKRRWGVPPRRGLAGQAGSAGSAKPASPEKIPALLPMRKPTPRWAWPCATGKKYLGRGGLVLDTGSRSPARARLLALAA